MNIIFTMWQDILRHPAASAGIVLNLILIESLLSVDNAAVLATMVLDLPGDQRKRALRYGIIGAYLFRGLAMIFAGLLIRFWFLKPLGGIYLLYLVYQWWKDRQQTDKGEESVDKNNNWIYRMTASRFGHFWSTVLLVEIMDMAFSIDNIFAAVAFTPNVLLVCLGVFIGILAMRFIAQWFVKLMERYPALESSAFLVIAILGIKLTLSLYEHFYSDSWLSHFLSSPGTDLGISILTILVFFVPVIGTIIGNRKAPTT